MPPDYPARLQELCRAHGILWVDDEVQSGCGRTGTMWAIEQYEGAEPDMIVFGKSIGGGLPLAGVTGRAEVMDAVPPGGLGGTFGGNPLSCAAALVVLDVVSEPEFLASARRARRDAARPTRRPRRAPPGDRRGARARLDARVRVRRAHARPRARRSSTPRSTAGSILLSCGLYGNVIRLLPPLNIAPEELDEGLAILEESLGA